MMLLPGLSILTIVRIADRGPSADEVYVYSPIDERSGIGLGVVSAQGPSNIVRAPTRRVQLHCLS